MINAHTLFKDLVAAGMPEGQAEVISNLYGGDAQSFATKGQVYLLEKDQVDIKTDLKIIKNDIANIKDMIKWVMGIFLTNMALTVAILSKLVF